MPRKALNTTVLSADKKKGKTDFDKLLNTVLDGDELSEKQLETYNKLSDDKKDKINEGIEKGIYYKELLDIANNTEDFLTREQYEKKALLDEKHQKEIDKAFEKRRENEVNRKISNEFKRVYDILLKENPEVAKGIALSAGMKAEDFAEIINSSEDENQIFMTIFKNNKDYSLNEALIAIIQDTTIQDEAKEAKDNFLRISKTADKNSKEYLNAKRALEEADKKLKENEEVKEIAKERIYTKNLGLIISLLKTYNNKDDGKMTMADIGQDCRLAFFTKAVAKYDLSRGAKFSTYTTTVLSNLIKSIYTNKVNKMRTLEDSLEKPITGEEGTVKTLLDYQVDPNPTGEEIVRKEAENEILYNTLNMLSLEEKFVVCCRYGLGGVPKKTQAEIADYMHMSQANVSKIEGNMRVKLKKLLTTEGMF